MTFTEVWHTLLEACEDLSAEATFVAPLSERRFRITNVRDDRFIIEFVDSESSRPLPRDQVEALHDRVVDASTGNETGSRSGFALGDLPRGTEPYAAVLSLYPSYEVDERAGVITETDDGIETSTQLVDAPPASTGTAGESERIEPDVEVYSDALLLIDALERHDPADLEAITTPALVNLYTLLSDVQRGADALRKEASEVLLDRVHHDQPVHGQFGSIQRTSRRRRTLKDESEVLTAVEAAGIPRERVLGVDHENVDEALNVLNLSESAVYDVEEREYVRNPDVVLVEVLSARGVTTGRAGEVAVAGEWAGAFAAVSIGRAVVIGVAGVAGDLGDCSGRHADHDDLDQASSDRVLADEPVTALLAVGAGTIDRPRCSEPRLRW